VRTACEVHEDSAPSLRERIYEVVSRIPQGRVATYGQVSTLAGMRGHARQVGYALHGLAAESAVPWHRVINSRGEISPRSAGESDPEQRALLEAEGVEFDAGARVDLARFRWRAHCGVSDR
jgi:methylated-DNA-protein-cysteine methyltransferase-like protein